MINKDLGLVTAYAYAVSKGYTGTEDEFAELMASYASVAEQAEESAEDSEAWAIGKRGGTEVPSTDETYHNNSKYYAGQAGTSASTAASSASAASASESNAAASASSAAGSASSATTSAATATEKAGEASTSATAAGTSATNAAGSATNAASSATAASASATAAVNAQTAAETAQGKAEDAQEAAEQAQSDAEAAAQSVSQSAAQISQNTSDISDLKSALSEYPVKVGFNLFDKTKIVPNTAYRLATGELVENVDNFTILIPVDSVNNLRIRSNILFKRVNLFDENKVHIRGQDGSYAIAIEGASFVGLTYLNSDDPDSIMVAYTQETSGSYSDLWNTVFPDAPEYVPYGHYIDAKNVSIDQYDETVLDKINDLEIQDTEILNQLNGKSDKNDISYDDILDVLRNTAGVDISEDTYTGRKISTFTGTSGTVTWASVSAKAKQSTAYLLEFYGKTSSDEFISGTGTASMLVIEFFDKNNIIIGSKYNSYVMGKKNMGYHRYGFVSPWGCTYVRIRFVTRGECSMNITDVTLKPVTVYPQKLRNGILIDGHLGCTFSAPKNTMPSFELGKIAGYNTMITNVQTTSDGVLVALHDATIDATSNGTGEASSYTFEQLQSFDFGSWFNASYTGTKIPKFEDVIKFLVNSGIRPAVSLHGNLANSALDGVCDIFKKYSPNDCLIKSFSVADLQYVYNKLGNNAEYMFSASSLPTTSQIDAVSAIGADRLSIDFSSDYETAELIEYAKNKGLGVSVYFGNNIQKVKKEIGMGINRFTVDTFSDIVFPMD